MQHIIVLGKHNFNLRSNIVTINTEGKGSVTLDDTTYTIYSDFSSIDIFSEAPRGYLDTEITLYCGNQFDAAMSRETYDEIKAIIFEKKREEYAGHGNV